MNFTKFFYREEGVTMAMVLLFMFLAVPIVTGALSIASSLAVDSGVRTQILYRQQSALGAEEFAINSVINGNDIDGDGNPGGTYDLALNGTSTRIVITEGSLQGFVIPDEDGLTATKSVTPTTVTAGLGTAQTLNYTITVENTTSEIITLKRINDGLPMGFDNVVAGSTVTTGLGGYSDDPAETWHEDKTNTLTWLQLSWDLVPLRKQMAGGEIVTLSFDTEVTNIPEDAYCNEVWLLPEGSSSRTIGTAKVIAGAPVDTMCINELVKVTTKAYVFPNDGTHPVDLDGEDPDPLVLGDEVIVTYYIQIENLWTQDLGTQKVLNTLPGDYNYITGSITDGFIDPDTASLVVSTLTTEEPSPPSSTGNRQRQNWSWAPGGGGQIIPFTPGDNIRTLTVSAYLPLNPGEFWNDTQVQFIQLDDWSFSWPTSVVYLMRVSAVLISGNITEVASLNGDVWVDYGYMGD